MFIYYVKQRSKEIEYKLISGALLIWMIYTVLKMYSL